jgi:hypothetical protein
MIGGLAGHAKQLRRLPELARLGRPHLVSECRFIGVKQSRQQHRLSCVLD